MAAPLLNILYQLQGCLGLNGAVLTSEARLYKLKAAHDKAS